LIARANQRSSSRTYSLLVPSDRECKSLWCGCNYGSDMVCLPSTDYPKDCV